MAPTKGPPKSKPAAPPKRPLAIISGVDFFTVVVASLTALFTCTVSNPRD